MIGPTQPPLNHVLEDAVTERFIGRVPRSPAGAERVSRPGRYGDRRVAGLLATVILAVLATALILLWF